MRATARRPSTLGAPGACAVATSLLFAALAGAGCGIAGGTGSLGPTTTAAVTQARLTIDPAEGPVGTMFSLAAEGMTPGAAVQFEITFPGEGRAYPGNALVVADDGTASATYRATSANQPGTYTVRLSGPQGQLATGEFRVTDGKPLVSSTLKAPSTTGARSGTTSKGGSTTTAGKGPTTTKAGAPAPRPTTTTTAGPVPTTVPPTSRPTTPPTSTPPTT